jgi:hypothetical protein
MNPFHTALPLEQMLDRRRHPAVVRGVVGRTEHVGHSICDTVGAHLKVRPLYPLCAARVQSIIARIGPHHRFAPLLLLSSLVKGERTCLPPAYCQTERGAAVSSRRNPIVATVGASTALAVVWWTA